MSTSWKTTVMLTILALVFTLGLTFTAVEIPGLLDSLLGRTITTPALATGQDADTAYKTRLFLDHYHLREIGYASLALTILLIVIGLARNRKGLASAGAILLFLPVFGQFAATMFFLGGLSFLRLLWLPFLDVSFDFMRLGDIALWPYRKLLEIGDSAGLNLYPILPPVITGIGLFVFILGTLAWFVARNRGRKVVDFWIYRISRHPQYLGWIIWSYGIMLLPGDNQKRYFELSNSLAWILSTLVIIGVALFEELRMRKIDGPTYKRFQERTPFLFPLPGFANHLLKWPLRLLFKKNRFRRKREILIVLLIYLLIIMGLSAWSSGLLSKEKPPSPPTAAEMQAGVDHILYTGNRLTIRRELKRLAAGGQSAVPGLLSLLEAGNPIVRWYTVDALSGINSPRVVAALIERLRDPHHRVRNAAAGALGRLHARNAIPELISALKDPERNMANAAARALGKLGDRNAVAPLSDILLNSASAAAAEALGNLGFQDTTPLLIRCLEERRDCPFNQVGEALRKLGSPRAADAFARGLEMTAWWQRCTAIRGLAELGTSQALRLVISTLDDPEPRVRRTSVWVIRKFPAIMASRIRAALAPMLSDPDMEVRLYAGDTLRRLPADAASPGR